MSKKAVVIYSGGMDSYTLMRCLYNEGWELAALSFDYGQRHKKELEFARDACADMNNIPHHIVDLTCLTPLLQGSSLTSDIAVPEGHYSEANMKATVVPNRNMIMLSIAVGYAVSLEYDHVYTAVHAGDHAVYPDCRKEFIQAMDEVTFISNYHPVHIQAPFIDISKGEILAEGRACGVGERDYRRTWTCYKGGENACGKCGACVERLEAFDYMGWTDPLKYDDLEFYKEAIKNAK